MKKALSIIVTLSLLIPALVFSNGMNLNNAGTKAIGMGGAFVGLADDYSAVYYNPAGLTQLEGTSIHASLIALMPTATYKFAMPLMGIDIDTETESNLYPAFAFGLFMDLGEKMKVGLYANAPSGLGTEWDGADLQALGGPNGPEFEWLSKIGVIHFGPALAYDVNEKLAIGLSLNLSYGMLELSRPEDLDGDAMELLDSQYSEESSGMGYGVTIGAMFKASEKLNLGLSLRTKNTISFSGDAEIPNLAAMQLPTKSDIERDITWPIWVGAGIAFKATERLIITADVQMTQWESTHDELVGEYKDAQWNTMFTATGKDKLELKWENTTSIRFGGMYKLTPCLDVMAGFYLDPAPGVNETANILLPGIDNNVITFGFAFHKGVLSTAFAFEYLVGSENEVSLTDGGMPGKHNMNIPVPSLSISYGL